MIRQVTTLLAGNALSQIIHVVTILVVVGSFFGPAEYGAYSVVMSYVGIISSIACFRYELGIVSVRGHVTAANIVSASVAIALVVSFLGYWFIALLIHLFGSRMTFGATPLVIALLVFLKALEQIAGSILYRHEAYRQYSVLKLVQAVILLGGFYFAGIGSAAARGMLLATLASYLAFSLGGFVVAARYGSFRGIRVVRMRAVLRNNQDFLRYSTPQTLIDNTLTQGINFALVGFAGSGIVGHYNFMQKILKAPLGLLFAAVSQVLFRFCAKNHDRCALVRTTLLRTYLYVVSALLAVLVAVFFAYEYFEFLPLPEQWAGLRDYILPFSVWMLSPFLFTAFATVPVVYSKQRQFFLVATSYNVLTLLVLMLMFRAGLITAAFWILGLTSILYYLGMNRWLLRIVDDHCQN